ncbi:MAG: hypothetical protein AAB656_01290 [Patescibacteria group bacterium]
MGKIKIAICVLAIFILAFYLRVMFLPKNILTFGYDQARDAIISQQILKGDLKIQGPPASTPGLYHGVFYYYVLAPAYLLGNGSPIVAAYWIAFLNSLVVFIVFYLTYLISKRNVFAALLASFLFAVSFEATQYATWLSNPTIAIWTVQLMYLGLWIWLKEKRSYGVVLAGIGLGLSIQAEIFLAYHLVPLAFWVWTMRRNVTKKQCFIFIVSFLSAISTMIVNELKFGFQSIAGLRSLALSTEANLAYAKSVGDYLILYLNQVGRIFAFNSYPGNIGYGGGILLGLIFYSFSKLGKSDDKMQPTIFLSTWLFSHLTVVTVGGTSTPFLMVGIGPAVSIMLSLYIAKLFKNYKLISIIITTVLVFANISMIARENKSGSTLFSIQKDMLLSKQLSVVDYTYEKAQGKPFSLNTLTSPLWINIVWTYVYKWYGMPKYGYLPTFHGHDQIGILDSLTMDEGKIKNYFLILEPMGGIPTQYLELTLGEENSVSKLLEEKTFGEIRVQERIKI